MIWNDPMLYPSESGVNYLCFTANTAGSTVALNVVGTPTQGQAFEYSTDAENWDAYVPGTTGAITLANVGDKVYFRGDNSTVSESTSIYHQFAMTGSIAGSGSIMTLLDKTDALRSLDGTSYAMFNLFNSCTHLTSPPELPATTLGYRCYYQMFWNCTSLTTAPELPASTLTTYCYRAMFRYCSALTEAPELPATTLTENCYREMFYGCTNLASIKVGYTGTFASAPTNAFTNWVSSVAASGDFYYNGTDTTTGVSAIPSGWTVHTY